jgi:tRNA A37 threonylcarbamoyladenosine modification protein TsaB
LIGISSFDALARVAGGARTATWIDAWRGEVYAAVYDNGRMTRGPAVVHPLDELEALRATPTRFIGDGVALYRDLIERTLGEGASIASPAAPLLAGMIARLADEAARRGECPPPHAIRPLYVRRSDAELIRDARAHE